MEKSRICGESAKNVGVSALSLIQLDFMCNFENATRRCNENNAKINILENGC